MALQKTWRWFGQNDPVRLTDLKQIGVEGVVTSLHHIRPGEIWPKDEILKLKSEIEKHDLNWSVVESLPVSEGIKTHNGDYDRLITNYIGSLENLGACGLDTVCYNFMPVIDWVRTDLHYKLPSGGEVMYFNYPTFAAFDIFILKRPGADKDYSSKIIEQAKDIYENLSKEQSTQLAYNIIVFTQGFIHGSIGEDEKDYITVFLNLLAKYKSIDRQVLRKNLKSFLDDILPAAEKFGIKMCIHPDDPPFPLLGLPRIVSTHEDLGWIFNANQSPSNGFTYCSGSLSARKDNDLEKILESFIKRVHFVHLRNNTVFEDGSFHESGHIDGDANLPRLVEILLQEQNRRIKEGQESIKMPVRPDHGIKILDDFHKATPPGYPIIGRLKGLMEIKGIEAAIEMMLEKQT
jgi:mannonate dehydratase